MKAKTSAVLCAALAALLYGMNIPLSKEILAYTTPTVMAALLYLGAGVGMSVYSLFGMAVGKTVIREPLTKRELPWTIAMVVLDIAAPILLMFGVARTNSATASLLNNFEIVATALIAACFFGERLSGRLRIAILLVTGAGVLLGLDGGEALRIDWGALFVLGACICWGAENNCTKRISTKSSVETVIIKGLFSGTGSLITAFVLGEALPSVLCIAVCMVLGFVSYGLSIHFYIQAQKDLGAAKTSAFYSAAPFIGVLLSLVLVGERPGALFYLALAIMAAAAVLLLRDTLSGDAEGEK